MFLNNRLFKFTSSNSYSKRMLNLVKKTMYFILIFIVYFETMNKFQAVTKNIPQVAKIYIYVAKDIRSLTLRRSNERYKH